MDGGRDSRSESGKQDWSIYSLQYQSVHFGYRFLLIAERKDRKGQSRKLTRGALHFSTGRRDTPRDLRKKSVRRQGFTRCSCIDVKTIKLRNLNYSEANTAILYVLLAPINRSTGLRVKL